MEGELLRIVCPVCEREVELAPIPNHPEARRCPNGCGVVLRLSWSIQVFTANGE